MKTAEEYRRIAFESQNNTEWIAKVEREIARASSQGMLFYETLKWGCPWVNNPLNIEYLEKKGYKVSIWKPEGEFKEWVSITWKE